MSAASSRSRDPRSACNGASGEAEGRAEPKPAKRSCDWCQVGRPTGGCSSGWFRPEGHDGSTPKCAPQALRHQAAPCDLDDGPRVPPDALPESALSSAEHTKNCTKHAGYRTHSKPRAERKNDLGAPGILGPNCPGPNAPAQFSRSGGLITTFLFFTH